MERKAPAEVSNIRSDNQSLISVMEKLNWWLVAFLLCVVLIVSSGCAAFLEDYSYNPIGSGYSSNN